MSHDLAYRTADMAAIGVLINSCASYAPKTLGPLLASLEEAAVPPSAIRVVIGDCPVACDEQDAGGVSMHRRRTAMLDNNGFAWAALDPMGTSWDVEWLVYLHDTCTVHPDFWAGCRDAVAGLRGVDCARLRPSNSMGMGLYRTSWVRGPAVRACMADMYSEDGGGRLGLKHRLGELEDTLFKLAERDGVGVVATLQRQCTVKPPRAAYGTATKRLTEFYAVPGIYKLKANWGQNSSMTLCV